MRLVHSLQASRGLAALAVVAFHLSTTCGDARYLGHGVLTWLTWRMDLGVDFFFVLSGFIIAMIHGRELGQPDKVWPYLKKRFARLYPVYWIYLAIFIGLVEIGFGSHAIRPEGAWQWLTTLSLVRFENMLTPISPAWTLFHEVAFYAIFSLLILNRRFGLAAFLLWQLICLVLLRYPSPEERTPLTTYFAAYNFDFTIGIGAWLFSSRIIASRLSWLASGILLFVITYTSEVSGAVFAADPLFYALSFGIILSFIANAEAAGRMPRFPLLENIGNASYSIYLVHEAVLGLLLKIALKLVPLRLRNEDALYVGVFVSTILLGFVAYLVIERPVLAVTKKYNRLPSRQKPAGASKLPQAVDKTNL